MWTFGGLGDSSFQRWSAAARAALLSLGLMSVVPLVPACGAPTNATEELASGASDVEDNVDSGEGNVEPGSLTQALSTHTFDSSWPCSSGTSCEDTYDFNIPAATRVRIAVSNVGSQVVRIAALGPGGSTTNLLTNLTRDWSCSNSNSVTFVAPTAGDYRLKIGRDSSSGGTTGNYHVRFEGDPSITFLRQSGNNTRTTALLACGWTHFEPAVSYSCAIGRACTNVWDFEVPVTADITMQVDQAPSTAVHSMALYGPGKGPGDANLLRGTGAHQGWRCSGPGVNEFTAVRVLDTGRHRFAVNYEPELSTGGRSGTYLMNFFSTTPLVFKGRTVTNGARVVDAQAQCGYVFGVNDTWNCASGDVKCVDVFSAFSVLPTPITQRYDSVGASLARLAVRQTPQINALNGLATDRQCKGVGETDSANTLNNVQGTIAVTFGRSRGPRGDAYIGRVTSRHPLTAPTRTINDGTTNFATSCP